MRIIRRPDKWFPADADGGVYGPGWDDPDEALRNAGEVVSPPPCFVCVYDVGREYGGPEEGGWWYDTGDPMWETAAAFATEAEAVKYADLLRADFPPTGRRSSVLGGDDYNVEISRELPAFYPAERPHYE